MAKHFASLDKVAGKERGNGVILCQYDRKLWLSDNVVALPVEYIWSFDYLRNRMIFLLMKAHKKQDGELMQGNDIFDAFS